MLRKHWQAAFAGCDELCDGSSSIYRIDLAAGPTESRSGTDGTRNVITYHTIILFTAAIFDSFSFSFSTHFFSKHVLNNNEVKNDVENGYRELDSGTP
jgi:hypothetical protein